MCDFNERNEIAVEVFLESRESRKGGPQPVETLKTNFLSKEFRNLPVCERGDAKIEMGLRIPGQNEVAAVPVPRGETSGNRFSLGCKTIEKASVSVQFKPIHEGL